MFNKRVLFNKRDFVEGKIMNKIYKVIWSKVKHCYVVVSEITKRDGKSVSPTGLLARKAAVLAVMALCGVSTVLPTMPVRADTIGTYHAGDLKWDKDKHNKAEWDPNHPVTDEDYGSIGVRSGKARLSFLMGLISGETVAGKEDGLPEELKHRTAIGNRFRVFGFGATAYGYGTNAVGEGSLAVGHAATTNGNEGTAIGSYAKVLKGQGTVVGAHSWANDQAVALGADVRAQGYASISIGSDDADPKAFTGSKFSDKLPEETIKKIYKDMINDNPTWFKNKYMIDDAGNDRRVWSPNYAAGEASIAIGSRTVALGDDSTSIGVLAMALADRSTALGVRSLVSSGAKGGMALGEESRVMSKDGLAVGNKTYSSGDGSLAYGYDAKALGANSIAIGHNVGANAMLNSEAQNTMANVLLYNGEGKIKPTGTRFDTTQDRITYLEKIMAGYDKKNKQWVDDEGSVLRQWKDGNNGPFRTEYRKKQAQVGPKQWSDNAIAIGRRTYAIGNNSLVLGSLSLGAGNNSLNVGHFTYTKGENSAAIGMEAAAIADNSMAIGVRSFANLTNSVAIGVGSKTDYTKDDLEQDGWAPRNAITFPSSTQVGVVSVGKIGSERRISNVASGYRDTDAVNVSQLRSLEERFSSNLPEDSDLNPFSYLAVDKKSGDVTKVIPLQKKEMNYRKYVNYRIKQIELQVREKNKEKVDETFKNRIQNVITNLEKGDNKTGIDASGLKGKNVDTILNELKAKYPGLDTSDTNDVINKLNEWKKEKLKDSLTKALTNDEQGFLKGTNYLNDGAKGKDAIAVGYKAQSLADNSIAIGKDSHVEKGAQGGIALGALSRGTRAGGQRAYDFGKNTVYANDGDAGKGIGGLRANKSTSGALSIGSDSITRQITNVAGGSEDTDAVNVAQLKQVNNKINGVDNKISGVDNKVNDVNTKVEGNIGFNIEGNTGGQPWVSAGTKASQKGKISLKIRGGDNDSNINVDLGRSTNDGFDTIEAKINLNHNLNKLESATFTKDKRTSTLNQDGLTIGSGKTAVALTKDGLNMGGQEITNVKESTTVTSAATVGQINTAKNELKTEITTAQNTATAANSTATQANSTANTANSTANTAKLTAEQAKGAADKVNKELAAYKTEVTKNLNNKANTDLDNLTQNGKTVVKNLAKEQIDSTVTETFVTGKVKKGSVTSKTLTVTGDGKVVGADLTLDIKDKAISKGKLSDELVTEIEGKATKAEVANKAEKTYV
ncbi:Hep/Hag repeat protein, partial [Megasphaera hutchinsoni]